MEKYVKPSMEVVEIETEVKTFGLCDLGCSTDCPKDGSTLPIVSGGTCSSAADIW